VPKQGTIHGRAEENYQCFGRHSNRVPPEYESTAFPKSQPVQALSLFSRQHGIGYHLGYKDWHCYML
jgi:hypothetical protein